jgi:hypothetical protein
MGEAATGKGAAKITARYRWSVAARVTAGTFGAYGVTTLATVALSFVLARLGMVRAEAVLTATLASYAGFAAIAMAAFHARSAARAWLWLAGTALPLGLIIWLTTPTP